jgi:hypothetical protein
VVHRRQTITAAGTGAAAAAGSASVRRIHQQLGVPTENISETHWRADTA